MCRTPNMDFPIIFLIVVYLCLPCNGQGGTCNDAYSCELESLVSNDTSSISCYGYFSCVNSPSIESRNTGNIYCHGSFSCYKSYSLIASTFSNIQIECHGAFSCARIENGITSSSTSSYIGCYGTNSCAYNTIITSSELGCWGFGSCMNSHIIMNGNNVVQFYGFGSSQNSIIESNSSDITIIFYAANSGNGDRNTSVICNDGDTCTIVCGSNSCNNVEFIKQGGAVLSFDCGFATVAGTGDNGCTNDLSENSYGLYTASIYVNDIPMVDYNLTLINSESINIMSCNSSNNSITNAVNCDDYQACQSIASGVLSTSDEGTICCTAANGCLQSNVTSIRMTNITQYYEKAAVRCEGKESCGSNNIFAPTGGDIYLSGSTSGHGSSTNAKEIVETTDEYNIYCGGFQSCRYRTIKGAKNVYVLGWQAADSTTIRNVGNIYVIIADGMKTGDVVDVTGDVVCNSIAACAHGSYSDIGGSIYGLGWLVLFETEITNVGNSVYALGYQAFKTSSVTNASNVSRPK